MHPSVHATTLEPRDIEHGLKRIVVRDQLELIKLRNRSPAFHGELEIHDTDEHVLQLTWTSGACTASLSADLLEFSFRVTHRDDAGTETQLTYN